MTWLPLYEEALASLSAAAGYYNRNVGVRTTDGKVNVRIPLAAADIMDIRLWREEEVLGCIRSRVGRIPELRHVSQDPRFQVHDFIEGSVLNDLSPRGRDVPVHVLTDVVTLMDQLARIPEGTLPVLPGRWPDSGDTAAFGRSLAELTQSVHRSHAQEYCGVFAEFGIPKDPLAVIENLWSGLTTRPFGLLHADLHRRNMIVSDGVTWFLDWELALWGDPMYEIAIHLHKMDYPKRQRAEVLRQWRERLPGRFTAGPDDDLHLYGTHERIKSAIVDTVRYSKQLATAGPPQRAALVGRLAAKLNAVRPVWGLPPDMTPERVAAALSRWSE
ncbi:aminoglycoside phosphotransferase family protein [Streptomyces sp. NPDC014894]|uniref:aminoglycoside phosphotransferase family protein n=1 Tax=Streptomyces sp. NPDC014894 TaxID=3364931 RepID=UPI0036F5432D